MTNAHHYKKILVIRFSSLGDVILTTPLLKTLRKKFPESEIHYCVFASYADVLKYNPNVDRLIEVNDKPTFAKLREIKKKLRQERYDLILDAHNNLRTVYLRLFMPGEVRKFRKYSFRKFLLVKFKWNLMKGVPSIAERQLSILNTPVSLNEARNLINSPTGGFFAGAQNDTNSGVSNCIPETFTNEDSQRNAERKLKEAGISGTKELICIVAGAGHFTKTYPAEYLASLLTSLRRREEYNFVLVGKGKDKKNIEIIKKLTTDDVCDLCDKLSLPELAEVMRRCSLVITGDTGPMHIAEAVGVPIVMIAGSSVREFGFFPLTENSVVIENEGLPCRPCSHIGRESCPLGHFKCMMELKPERVYEKMLPLTNM